VRPDPPARRRASYPASLLVVLVIAAALRVPLLPWAAGSYRTTEAFSLEEVENVRISSGMLHERSANPHAFEYPSLFYYLSLAVEAPVRALLGPDWRAYLIAVRGLSLGFGLLAIGLAAELARRLGGPLAGLLAAALVATDRTMIDLSVAAKPNMAQLAFLLAGFVALAALATGPRLRTALLAAGLFALATASKWLGALGLAGLALAPALATGNAVGAPGHGLRGLLATVRRGLTAPVAPSRLLLPLVVFAGVVLLAMPFALLSPREFGYGLGQVFLAQSMHRRALPAWVSLDYLLRSLGPIGLALCAGGVAWGVRRVLRWDGTPRARLTVLVLGWALAYGGLVLFVFARLPSYVDLWVPFLAVLAGAAWAGDERLVPRRGLATAVVLVALGGGLVANAGLAWARARGVERDTRTRAASWLAAHARATDTLVADFGVLVPDSLTHVRWNWWGSPPRLIYDETRTWGDDPIWPDDWYGGHRQVLFVNARWAPPESLLATRPRFVVTHEEWVAQRAHPEAGSRVTAEYDARLADGTAGYAEVARFTPRASDPLGGPDLRIFERRAGGAR
jgi:4-amino-4-deoxy-L-arabinose transferase-like glycosyltransferase